jgi:serine/threonine protein kinase
MKAERFGRFRIIGEIGLGGMARVYRAYDPQRQREVAIKALPPEYLNDLGFRARFEQEAQLVIALRHKAIVPVYEYGEHDGQPYIVMKYMPNGSLAERLGYGPLDLEEITNILERISNALDYAHRQGVVHRDLKPSNILFDRYGKAYLADFGIASHASRAGMAGMATQAGRAGLAVQASQDSLNSLALSSTDVVSGTPAYMSPEQVLREQIDNRSDIYSLGVIAFEMLCGRPPFQGDSPIVVALMQVYDPPPHLSTLREGLPPALEPVVMRLLSKDARERYPTCAAFLDAFRRALQPEPEMLEGANTLVAEEKAEHAVPGQLPDQPEHHPAKANPHMRAPPASPALPEIQPTRGSLMQPASKSNVLAQLIVAMGLATWLGVVVAVVISTLAWGEAAAAEAKVQLVFDDVGMSLINLSGKPLDVSGLSFQRFSELGVTIASFAATQWEQSGLGPVSALPAGACYQLLSPHQVSPQLKPGEAPLKPAGCRVSQGWLLAPDGVWQFWTAEAGGGTFQVLYAGQVIHTCQIAEGRCQFTLPEH